MRGGLNEKKDVHTKAGARATKPVPGPAKKKVAKSNKIRSGQRGRKSGLVGLFAVFLGLVLVVLIVKFPFDSGTPEQSTAAAPAEQSTNAAPPAPAAPATEGIEVGVEKFGLTHPLPNNQLEITIKPRIGNS